MSDQQLIESVVQQAGRRWRLYRLWVGLWKGLFFGSLACLFLLGLYKILPLPAWMPWAAFSVGGAVCLILALAGVLRPITTFEAARWLDSKQRLHERLSTALELGSRPAQGEWERLVVADAAQHVKRLDPRRLLPMQFPRIGRWALLALILVVGLGFVPAYRSQAFRERKEDQARVEETGRKVAELVRQELARRKPVLAPTEKALEAVADTGDQLAKGARTREAALHELAQMQNRVGEHARKLAEEPGVRPLHQAARQPSGGGDARKLQEQMAALQNALGDAAKDPGKLADLQRQLEALSKQAAALGQTDPAAGDAARAELAKAMAEAAEQARNLGVDLPNLDAAIAALQASQDDVFLRDLNAAITELEKLKEMGRQLESLAQQGSKTGADLAEQLEKGQAQAAQGTLRRMIDQLQSAQVSSEQLQKILEEVSKAIRPAGEYGQVAKELQKAAENLRQNETGEAAQHLANAAQELGELMQQLKDLEALEGALAALARAQNALAARKTWSDAQKAGQCAACNGMGCALCNGRPAWGPGGRGGAGVGTWADNDSGAPPAGGPTPDNSGVQRPDMNPRDLTDRPDNLNPNLLPDRVKGELSAGGSMPSVPLKGVSIPGTSTVEYEEAMASAQAEAQSALNQDRIPRAYQSVVKKYFDDLE